MAIKRKPHHDLTAVQAKFARVETLEITRTAINGAYVLGYSLEDIVEAVRELEPGDFIKSETAQTRPTRSYGTTPTICRGMVDGCI